MAVGQTPRRDEAAMYAEYGARVKLDERYDYPMNGGTIVGTEEFWDMAGDEYETVYTIARDFDGQECNYVREQFTVTMAPTQCALDFLRRWDIDTALETMENIFSIGAHDRTLERYQGALIVAFYTLYVQEENRRWFAEGYSEYAHNRECVCAECDPVLWEDNTTRDDGSGYPVYRVED